jgi:SAM-dependent methyltransferase
MTTANVQHPSTVDFLKVSPSPEGKTVMDVGCGDGFASRKFVEAGAVEVFANDLLLFEDKLTDFDQSSEFLQGIEFCPMDERAGHNGKMDIVWCHHCLEHQEEPIAFLKDLHALLKPDGELWLAVPNMRDNLNLSPGHTMAYNMPLLIEHLKRAWFNVKDGAFWANRYTGGHLRVRLGKLSPDSSSDKKSDYPKPMQEAFDETGRCPAEAMKNWNWFPKEEEKTTGGFIPVPDHEPGQIDPDL